MADKKGSKKHGKDRASAPVIADPRFAKLHSDPRFQRIPKGQQKVAIDPRFEGMFKDPAFQTKFTVDKRGRSKKGQDADNLQKYYRLDRNDEKQSKGVGEPDSGVQAVAIEDSPLRRVGADKKGKKKVLKIAREIGNKEKKGKKGSIENPQPEERPQVEVEEGQSESSDGSDSEAEPGERDVLREGFDSGASSSDSDDEESELEDEGEDKWEEPEKVPTSNEETRRLAIVNLDWEYIRAVDILVMLKSFLPESGSIQSVTVYPSDFGLERMKEEDVKGPQPLWGADHTEESDDDSDDEDAGVDMEKLREYEKSKLKYYYAVVTCDAPSTANVLYSSCDGLEFEKSANKLDLRFIPDEMSFEGRSVRDRAESVPADYAPPDFETRALQHSSVKLTWDEDEPLRQKTLRRKFGKDEVDNLDFNAYMADTDSDSDDEDSDAEPVHTTTNGATSGGENAPEEDARKAAKGERREREREKLRALLLGGMDKQGNEGGDGEESEDEEMEITFNTGLNDLGTKLEQMRREKERQKNETTWEAYLRKKKERHQSRKKGPAAVAASDSDASPDDADGFFQHDENPFDDPFFADDKSANGKATRGKGEKAHNGVENGREKELERGRKGKTERELERERKREELESARKEKARRTADLELLMMDDDLAMSARLGAGSEAGSTIPAGFNLKSERRREKEKSRLKKKGQTRVDEDAEEDARDAAASRATVNFEDPRFGALFTSHHFAIDPTDPRFSKSAGQMEVLAEKQRRRIRDSQTQRKASNGPERNVETLEEAVPLSKQPKAELSSLVKSLKRKVEAKATKDSQNKEPKRTKGPQF